MEFERGIVGALLVFGAYRVWTRETFLGAKRQWLKLLIYIPVAGIASVAFLVEAIFRGNPNPRLTKKGVSKEIKRGITGVLKVLPLFTFEGYPDVEARRYVENTWAQMMELSSKPTPHYLCVAAYILAINTKLLHDKQHPNAEVLCMALANVIKKVLATIRKPNSSDAALTMVAMKVCEHLTQPRTPAEQELQKMLSLNSATY